MMYLFIPILLLATCLAAAESGLPPVVQALTPMTGGGGLCVVLDGGDQDPSPLLESLAEGRRRLVHVLTADRDRAMRIRDLAAARGWAGQVQVEYPLVNPLPYVRHLADAVVVTHPETLERAGITASELIRIAAPGASLFRRSGTTWTQETVPRPTGWDVWTHTRHDPGETFVSNDQEVPFPGGLRWVDSVPMNLDIFISTRALIADERRVFTLTPSEPENVGKREKREQMPMYLTARSALNGLVLWKRETQYPNPNTGYLSSLNTMALACDQKQVYLPIGTSLQGLNSASGTTMHHFANRHPVVARIFVQDGVLVAASWADRTSDHPRSEWFNSGTVGAIQAFDTATSKVLWEHDLSARRILGADGLVYALVEPAGATFQVGKPMVPTSQELVAIELKSGVIRWRVPHTVLSPTPTLSMMLAGSGILLVTKTVNPPEQKKNPVQMRLALDARDGHLLWEQPAANTYLVDGELLEGGGVHRDVRSGTVLEPKGPMISYRDNRRVCTPDPLVAKRWSFEGRNCRATDLARPSLKEMPRNGASRAPCGIGYIPANGMYYCAQNACGCCQTQIRGLLAFGTMEASPTAEDYAARRPVETGPAFGAVPKNAVGSEDWPEFLGDATRSNLTGSVLEGSLKVLWTTQVAVRIQSSTWEIQNTDALTGAVVAYGLAIVAVRETGDVVALDLATGTERWRHRTGSRISVAPSLSDGYCFVGTRDGWVQALRASDGVLAWRARAAPLEQRITAFGRLESTWPVPGLAVHDGRLFASAGRNSEIGGVAMVAFDPATGVTVWGQKLDRLAVKFDKHPPVGFHGDVPVIRQGKVGMNWLSLESADGSLVPGVTGPDAPQDGLVSHIHGLVNTAENILQNRGAGANFGKISGRIFAWDAERIYVAADRLNAYDRSQASALKPVLRWQVVITPQAMVLAGDRLAVIRQISRPKQMPESWLELYTTGDQPAAVAKLVLDGTPVPLGLAVARNRALVSLEDGRLVCVGSGR